jgi:hypothetical protein
MAVDWRNRLDALGDLGSYEMPQGSSVDQAQRRLRLAAGNDEDAQRVLRAAWKAGDDAIQVRQDAFLAKIAAARAAGTPVTEAWLYQVARLDKLRAYVAAQYTDLGVTLERQVKAGQRQGVAANIEAVQDMVRAMLPGGKRGRNPLDFAGQDVRVGLSAVVSMLQSGAPLRDLTFSNLSVEGAASVADALVRGATTGASIRDIAAAMRLERNMTLARASTIARTEILRANRLASLQTMRTATISTPNGTMKATTGWKWSCAPGGRGVCGVCLSMAGSVHPTTEDFESHPNCRCAPVPLTPTWADMGFGDDIPEVTPNVPTGDDLVKAMDHAALVKAYGPVRADLMRQGFLEPRDMVRQVNRGRWGQQPGLIRVGDAKTLAAMRGWVEPKPVVKPGAKPAPPPPPLVDVPGLDGLAIGPGHPVAKALDDAHADLVDAATRMNDAERAVQDATRGMTYDQRQAWQYSPEGVAVREHRDNMQANLRDRMTPHADRIKAAREAALADLRAKAGSLPLDQARRLLKELDDQERFLKVQAARVPRDYQRSWDPAFQHWKSLTGLAGLHSREMRALVAARLPIRERFRPPQADDWQAVGAKTKLGGGKTLAKVTSTWKDAMVMAEWQERTFGWPTHWSGRVEMGTRGTRNAAGVAHWDGNIGMARDYFGRGVTETKVMLHELFHMMSGNGNTGARTPRNYSLSRGWEEGVVERLAQLHLGDAQRALGRDPVARAFDTYGEYTGPLEVIRSHLRMGEHEFYHGLIAVNVEQRRAKVGEWAQARRLPQDQYDAIHRQMPKLGI